MRSTESTAATVVLTADELAEVLDNPAHFDLNETNASLARPYYALRQRGFHPRLPSRDAEYHDPDNTPRSATSTATGRPKDLGVRS